MNTPEHQPLPDDPRVVVSAILDKVMRMGANDLELSSLKDILAQLEAGRYENPQDAIAEAQEILDSKQADH